MDDATPITVVEVVERNPPADCKPVRWVLATTEAVATDEELLRVVDIYRTRWVVEEYFKAIKTGCAYEKRQLESARALLNMLSVTLPIAVHMLMMRDLATADVPFPASTLFDPIEIAVMRALTSGDTVPKEATVQDALRAIAKLGGHVKANGPPGWLVLYRGYVELVAAKRGFKAAFAMMGVPAPEM
jgi:hypothetical protein